MQKCKKSYTNVFATLLALALLGLSFVWFFNLNKHAFASTSMFEVVAEDYQEGTWAKQDVLVRAHALAGFEAGEILFSVNNPDNLAPYTQPVLISQDGENFVYFTFKFLQGGEYVYEQKAVEVKLDKTAPEVESVEISQQGFTTQPVSVMFYLADLSVFQNQYRATIFEQEYFPLEEFLARSQIVFLFETERNTVLNVGDVVFYDQANNQTIYNQEIVIDNIDNNIPDFHLNLVSQNSNSPEIEIVLGYIHSEAKEIVLILPNGKVQNLPILPSQKIKVAQSGTYLVKVVSNTNLMLTRGVLVNVKESVPTTFILFVSFVLVFGFASGGVLIYLINKKSKLK